MYANEIAAGRNWYTADTAKLVTGPDWARAELRWNDGGYAHYLFDDADGDFVGAARGYLREHGFNA